MSNQQSGFSIDESVFIGRGSYGTVYRARRDADRFPCAAKVLHLALADPSNREPTETTVRRIRDECSTLESLKHTNIVQYLGVARDRNLRAAVLLMELLPDAESLTKMLECFGENPLPYFTELNVCCDIASALEYLHSKYVIVRNLSSNNVFVIAKMRAKVADFGMCRLNDATNSTCSRSGTTVYYPPEALEENLIYTPKFDCFSQGVIIIQVCTRKIPDPGHRLETNTGSGVLIPECERRKNHISQIQNRGELLSIAKDCLKDKAGDRPTSAEIHERLATLKTTRKYQNSLESDYQKLWEDIVRHTRLLISEQQMREYSEENTGEENVTEQFEQVLKKADKICILVVGKGGDGVSTLLNGLFGEEKCQSREITKEFTVVINTYRIRGVVEATVIDCRNLHTNLMSIERNVSEVIEAVRPHGIPDLIIYSQKMGENIDADSQRRHSSVIEMLTAGFANISGNRAYKNIWKRCMFVLTFANEYEASLSEQRDKGKRFKIRWDEWTKIFNRTLHDSKVYVPMKVCVAGFREPKLHNSDHWLSDVWLTTFLTLSRSGALALLRVNAFRFVTAALLSEDLLPSEHLIIIDSSSPIISKVAVTSAGIGGTIGAVNGISFRVAAGSGLALAIALGSVVGLGVSGGVTAAIKRYKENKNFRKLPAL